VWDEEELPRLDVEEAELPVPLVPFAEGGIGARHGMSIPPWLQLTTPAALAVAGTRTATRATARIVANTFFMTSLLFKKTCLLRFPFSFSFLFSLDSARKNCNACARFASEVKTPSRRAPEIV